jgi:hypothetical protein
MTVAHPQRVSYDGFAFIFRTSKSISDTLEFVYGRYNLDLRLIDLAKESGNEHQIRGIKLQQARNWYLEP